MNISKERIKWILHRRSKYKKSIKGFHAHWDTFASLDSSFSEYVHMKKGANVLKSNIGRFSRITGTVCNAKIGAFCAVASRSYIGGGGEHPLDQVSFHSVFYKSSQIEHPCFRFTNVDLYDDKIKQVLIGNDVWIGSGVIVKQGVNIGDGAVVATGSVVVKDVPPYAIVGGVPAKIIKYRHSEELRQELINSQWWNWPLEALQLITKNFNQEQPLTIEKFKEIQAQAEAWLID